MTARPDRYRAIAAELAELVIAKQAAYGSSFMTSADALRLLYPSGIAPSRYGDVLTLARIWDKMMRIATDKTALGESPYRDILGYALLAVERDESPDGWHTTTVDVCVKAWRTDPEPDAPNASSVENKPAAEREGSASIAEHFAGMSDADLSRLWATGDKDALAEIHRRIKSIWGYTPRETAP